MKHHRGGVCDHGVKDFLESTDIGNQVNIEKYFISFLLTWAALVGIKNLPSFLLGFFVLTEDQNFPAHNYMYLYCRSAFILKSISPFFICMVSLFNSRTSRKDHALEGILFKCTTLNLSYCEEDQCIHVMLSTWKLKNGIEMLSENTSIFFFNTRNINFY